ncbi:MAG TPA: Ig-like domain-containing protein [Longimicrobium sp.]|nr:Ig-like domain-containing protein [Longimicrobium sp.]
MRPRSRRASHALALLLALAAAACTDRANPMATPTPAAPGTPSAPVTIQVMDCTADRAALSVVCKPAGPDGGGAAGDIIVGSQNVFVKLTSSNVVYNGGTGQFTFDVTVQNLIEQPMGTVDGTTLDPGGIRVFFHQQPTVTVGTGAVGVVPDGFATFTAAGQPYYQYNNVLAQNATSPVKGWTFVFPPTVTTFVFQLYVSAPVEYPNGYITLDGQLPGYNYGYLHPGDTHPLVAVVKTAVGTAVPGAVVFATTNAGCATVDGPGTVTGVQYATCEITATSGARTGSMFFDVSGTTRTWTGAVSADWNVGGNWGLGLVPATADSVVIPFPSTNYPALTSAVTISNVTVADQATLNVASFTLTSTGDVATGATAGSGILASGGQLTLTGTSKVVHGRFPTTLVTGTYSLDGSYWGVAPQTVDAGTIASDGFDLNIDAQ